jgi:predicted site-specific integrase-resolvase
MDDKERVLTLASAARKAGVNPDELKVMISEGKLDAVETEGGNLLISENSYY